MAERFFFFLHICLQVLVCILDKTKEKQQQKDPHQINPNVSEWNSEIEICLMNVFGYPHLFHSG